MIYMVGSRGIMCYYPHCLIDDYDDAVLCANELYNSEKDHYHTVQIHEWEMNKLPPLIHDPIYQIDGKHGAQ